MPSNHSVGLDDVKGHSPIGPQATEDVPEGTVPPSEGWSARIALQDLDLMAQGGIFENQGLASSKD
jgi:hypothetical protein